MQSLLSVVFGLSTIVFFFLARAGGGRHQRELSQAAASTLAAGRVGPEKRPAMIVRIANRLPRANAALAALTWVRADRLERTYAYHALSFEDFLALKQAGLAAGAGIGVLAALFVFQLNPVLLVFPIILGVVGFFVPDLWLRGKEADRHWDTVARIPDFFDLLTLNLRTGGGQFGVAFTQVAQLLPGPLGDELRYALRQIETGLSEREALSQLAQRVGNEDLHDFSATVSLASELGQPLARSIQRLSDDTRLRLQQRAEEQGQLSGILILIPLTIFILPSLMAIMLGPAIISIVRELGV